MNMKERVVALVLEGMTDNEEIASRIREDVPGATTTGASVSSMKSHSLRKYPS